MHKTLGVRKVAEALIASPHELHWAGGLTMRTGVTSKALTSRNGILARLVSFGLLEDAGWMKSSVRSAPGSPGYGGAPRKMYRVKDLEGLKELL